MRDSWVDGRPVARWPLSRRGRVAAAAALLAVLAAAVPAQAATAPSITLTPSALYFSDVRPYPITTTVGNGGRSATGTLQVAITSGPLGSINPQNFSIIGDTCTGRSLGPGATCSVTVAWTQGPDSFAGLTVRGEKASATALLAGTTAG